MLQDALEGEQEGEGRLSECGIPYIRADGEPHESEVFTEHGLAACNTQARDVATVVAAGKMQLRSSPHQSLCATNLQVVVSLDHP
eukprot:SAG31_NODE_339_length_17487_cov_20.764435_14_plen_85_part_00